MAREAEQGRQHPVDHTGTAGGGRATRGEQFDGVAVAFLENSGALLNNLECITCGSHRDYGRRESYQR